MKIIKYSDIQNDFFQKIDLERLESVEQIIKQVRQNGDSAIMELSRQFKDGDFNVPSDFIVSEEEIQEAYKKVSFELLIVVVRKRV